MGSDALAQMLYRRVVVKEPALGDLHDKQQQFVLTEAHHAAFIGGIGAGKSWAGAVRAKRAALGWIGRRQIRTPNLGVVSAPTYDMLRDATLRTFREVSNDQIVDFNKNEMLLTLKNGSEIIFRSTSHPDRLRGPSISWWWGDEAALYTPEVRRIMLGRLRQFGLLGYDWVTTTPRGRNHIYKDFVQNVQESERDDYFVTRVRSRDNTFMDGAIFESWEREYVGDFARQELEGEFVAFTGLIYGEFAQDTHVTTETKTFPRYVAGVDWGFANPGVILVIGVDHDGSAMVVRELYQTQTRVEEWVALAVQMRGIYRIERFYCDPAAPDNIRQFADAGLPTEAANNSVQTGIQAVKNRLARTASGQPRLMLHRECVHLIDEFESYQWAENRHGIRDEPVKAKDHAMDALRYAIMGVDHPRIRKVEAKAQRYA